MHSYDHNREISEICNVITSHSRDVLAFKLQQLVGERFRDFVLSSWNIDDNNKVTFLFKDRNEKIWTFQMRFISREIDLELVKLKGLITDRLYMALYRNRFL